MSKPSWGELKKNNCPRCRKPLAGNIVFGRPDYITCKCGFEIHREKYNYIINN